MFQYADDSNLPRRQYAHTTYAERANMGIGVEMNTPRQGASAVDQTWTSSSNRVAVPYTVETMMADITPLKDKPLWPLSSYGPAKHEPIVIGGLEESPEELRLKAVNALKAGRTTEYTKYEEQKTAAAEQVYANARDNVKQLYEQALKVSTQAQTSTFALGSSVSSFSSPTSSTFGASSVPSAFGGTTATAFGKPGFGQSAFGQTGFSGPASGTSAFGQGTQGTSAFGTPTQTPSAFGQPNQAPLGFGQTSQTTPAFGQPTQPSSVFGQPSAFSAAAPPTPTFAQLSTQPTSVFGKPSQPTSVFGGPSQPPSAFGQPSQPTSAFNPPAQPTSALSQPSQPTPPFGQPSQPAFGQSSLIKPASGAFGGGGFSAFTSQPSTFTSAATPSSFTSVTTPSSSTAGTTSQPAFGSTTTPGQSVFGLTPTVQSAFGIAPSAPKTVFGTSQSSAFGMPPFGTAQSTLPSPASAIGGITPFASSPMTVTPPSEKPVSGVPDFSSAKSTARMKPGADRYLALLPNDYEEMMPANIKAAFAGAKFEWGKIPDWIPPEGVR